MIVWPWTRWLRSIRYLDALLAWAGYNGVCMGDYYLAKGYHCMGDYIGVEAVYMRCRERIEAVPE